MLRGRTPATPGGGPDRHADRDVRATRAWRNPRHRHRFHRRGPRRRAPRNEGRGRTPATSSFSSSRSCSIPIAQRGPGPNPGNASPPSTTGQRGQPAGPAAGGRRARAGRRADSSIAGDRHVRALPRAERRRGSVPFRTGGRRHPAAPWGWEDLDSWLVPRLRAQAAPARHLAGRPRGDRPARQHYPRI